MERILQINQVNFEDFKSFMFNDFGKMLVESLKQKMNFQNNDEDIIYSLHQAAEFLGISIKTLYALNSKKEITYIKQSGKCYYSKKAILDFLKRGKVSSKYELEEEVNNLLPLLK